MRKRTLGLVVGGGAAVVIGSFTMAAALPAPATPVSDCRYSLTGIDDHYTITDATGASATLQEFAPDDTAPLRTVVLSGRTLEIQFLRGIPIADAMAQAEEGANEWDRLAEESLRTAGDGLTVSEVLQPGTELAPLEAFHATIDDGTGDAEYVNLPGGGYLIDETGHASPGCLRAPIGSTIRGSSVDDTHIEVKVP
jgi:hypothetical protein